MRLENITDYIFIKQMWYNLLVPKNNEKYSSSVPALLSKEKVSSLHGKLLTCFTPSRNYCEQNGHRIINADKPFVRLFSLFNDYDEFIEFLQTRTYENKCMYEIILGDLPQKPHFDIDIPEGRADVDGVALCCDVIQCCKTYFQNQGITLYDHNILLYTSLPDDEISRVTNSSNDNKFTFDVDVTSVGTGERIKNNKQSYHIVIGGYKYANNSQCRAFYDDIVTMVQPQFREWIDDAVYSVKQQFRVLGSHKFGNNKTKIILKVDEFMKNKKLIHKKQDTRYYDYSYDKVFGLQLLESLISLTVGCIILPIPISMKGNKSDIRIYDDDNHVPDITQDCVRLAETLFDKKIFKIREVVGNRILLNRKKSAYCKVCEKVHDGEHAYITYYNGVLYFRCRRATHSIILKSGLSSDYVEINNKDRRVGFISDWTEEIDYGETISYIREKIKNRDNEIKVEQLLNDNIINVKDLTCNVVCDDKIDPIYELCNPSNFINAKDEQSSSMNKIREQSSSHKPVDEQILRDTQLFPCVKILPSTGRRKRRTRNVIEDTANNIEHTCHTKEQSTFKLSEHTFPSMKKVRPTTEINIFNIGSLIEDFIPSKISSNKSTFNKYF